MTGKYISRKGMVDSKKSEEAMNSFQKREGKKNYHVDVIACQCPDPDCGAWHEINESRKTPTKEESDEILKNHNKNKK